MSPSGSRPIILVLVAFAMGAGSLFVPEPALAATALFRVEQRFFGAPFPAQTPGGAGLYQGFVYPYAPPFTTMGTLDNKGKGGTGEYYAYVEATVENYNPIGGAFTLQSKFIDFAGGPYSLTAKTGFPGYTTKSTIDYYNFAAPFKANNVHSGLTPIRLVFPTVGGNPTPNLGLGNPVTATTTFGGRYDFSRAGSINVEPGDQNQFGGTLRYFSRATASWYQYIFKFTPAIYKAYGTFECQHPIGVLCTSNVVSLVGDITASYGARRFLLNIDGTGTKSVTPPFSQSNKAKATTTIGNAGGYITPGGNKSFLTRNNYYFHLIHPWTTGKVSVYNYFETPFRINPQYEGYDKNLGGANITVTHYDVDPYFNKTLSSVTYTTTTAKQYLHGVERVVSLVRPKLVNAYLTPVDPFNDAIETNWAAARVWGMKIFFLPEPAAALMLGAGIAALLGLSRIRRR